MYRRTRPAFGLLALVFVAAGCSSSSTTTPSTTTTPTTTVTETFSGTLRPNGADSYPFVVLAAGNITATITALDGDTPPHVGLGVGTRDLLGACTTSTGNGKFNDTATKLSSIVVQASGAGSLCVRIYDSKGEVTTATSYEIAVEHP